VRNDAFMIHSITFRADARFFRFAAELSFCITLIFLECGPKMTDNYQNREFSTKFQGLYLHRCFSLLGCFNCVLLNNK
jgi:hypothetical protein